MPDPLRVLVADDEPFARQRLLTLLGRAEDVEVVGTAASGEEAVEQIASHRAAGRPVDVVFLDIQMPGGTGLDVVRRVGPEHMPIAVFVTAYDQHALTAFELAAVDYLLKPFENERFFEALARARERVRSRETNHLHAQLLALLEGRPAAPTAAPEPPPRPAYLERIAVEMRGQVRVVPVADVDYLTAEADYVAVHAGESPYLIRDTLAALEERLDPAQFVRVHRSTIVRLDRVEALLTGPGGDYAVRLRGGQRLKVARGRRDALAALLGVG